ncbi:MAG: CAAX prenyl protease-related protein [Verrucomicrobiota bacterium]
MTSLSRIAPFVAPFLAFMLFLSVEGYWPEQHYLLYPVKTAIVVAVLAWSWRQLPSLRVVAPVASVAVGVAGVVLWVGLDPYALRLNAALAQTLNHVIRPIGLGPLPVDTVVPVGRDPFALYPAPEAWVLFVLRLLGIALVVPVMEELFWRGFLMRWLIREDFTSVPLGTYQPASFWITTAFFASVHGDEWPLGVVVGVLYGAWFVRTKSLGSIMTAHGVTNFCLALYCLFSGDWHFLSTVNSPASGK